MAQGHSAWQEARAIDLIQKMLSGDILEIKATVDPSSEAGLSYPEIEKLLGRNAPEIAQLLEALAAQDILVRTASGKIFLCSCCHSPNLRPSLRCPKCGSGYVDKAQVLEHFNCGYVGVESEFVRIDKYVCPRCQWELKLLETDYRSLGIKYKCGNCSEIFIDPVFKWQCLGCLLLFAENEAKEIPLYTYYLNESRRQRLEFELGPKKEFITFLQSQGYEVMVPGLVVGRSGVAYTMDLLAEWDDSIIKHSVAIGVLTGDTEVRLEEIALVDTKAYDIGVHEKLMLVASRLSAEARQFADRQGLKVLEVDRKVTSHGDRPEN